MGRRKKEVSAICKFCKKEFETYIYRNSKYCSRTCYHKCHIFKPNKGSFKKGEHYSPKTEFKNGNHPHTEFKKGQNLGKNHPGWKGGETNNNGYIMILKPEHHFCDRQGRVRRSRLVMEKHLKRFLKPTEVVHHINKIKNDDRIKNLKLFINQKKHMEYHKTLQQR